MKRLILTALSFLMITNFAFAKNKYTDLKVGFLIPSDAKTGFLGTVGMGSQIDENISLGFGLNYYGKTYTKEENVADETSGNATVTGVVTEIENATRMFPLMFNLAYTNQISPTLDVRVGAGLGYALLWNSETNYEENIDKTRFYSGFCWEVGGGISHPLSRNSDVFAEITYFSATPSRDEGETDEGLPLRSEIDMSGVSMRIGIRLFNFGF